MPNLTGSANLRAEMARAGLSQTAVAELLGINPSQVSARMRGRIPWRVAELQIIAHHIGVPMADLIDDPAGKAATA